MSTFRIKRREFEIIQDLSVDSYIGVYKNKQYHLKKYDPSNSDDVTYALSIKKLSNTGVKTPKLYFIDKKSGFIVREYIDGETIDKIIAREDLDEDVYRQLFINAYMAKISRITLDYQIDNWVIADKTLYYVSDRYMPFKEEKDLVKGFLRYWFKTKELVEFLRKKGLNIDKNRVKDEYSTNKEMVLMTCKYYK